MNNYFTTVVGGVNTPQVIGKLCVTENVNFVFKVSLLNNNKIVEQATYYLQIGSESREGTYNPVRIQRIGMLDLSEDISYLSYECESSMSLVSIPIVLCNRDTDNYLYFAAINTSGVDKDIMIDVINSNLESDSFDFIFQTNIGDSIINVVKPKMYFGKVTHLSEGKHLITTGTSANAKIVFGYNGIKTINEVYIDKVKASNLLFKYNISFSEFYRNNLFNYSFYTRKKANSNNEYIFDISYSTTTAKYADFILFNYGEKIYYEIDNDASTEGYESVDFSINKGSLTLRDKMSADAIYPGFQFFYENNNESHIYDGSDWHIVTFAQQE